MHYARINNAGHDMVALGYDPRWMPVFEGVGTGSLHTNGEIYPGLIRFMPYASVEEGEMTREAAEAAFGRIWTPVKYATIRNGDQHLIALGEPRPVFLNGVAANLFDEELRNAPVYEQMPGGWLKITGETYPDCLHMMPNAITHEGEMDADGIADRFGGIGVPPPSTPPSDSEPPPSRALELEPEQPDELEEPTDGSPGGAVPTGVKFVVFQHGSDRYLALGPRGAKELPVYKEFQPRRFKAHDHALAVLREVHAGRQAG